MSELLIELFSEEIPARMQVPAMEEFKKLVTERLTAAGLSFARAEAYSTPRRIALHVDGLPLERPDVAEEKRGPKIGAPEQALQGFLKSSGLGSVEECEQRDGYYWAVKTVKGGKTADMLSVLIAGSIQALVWPKSMRWGETSFRWVRPLHSIIVLFDGRVVPGSLDVGDASPAIAFGDRTEGHRFLARGPITVTSFADYKDKLEQHRVFLDRDDRKEQIRIAAQQLASEQGLTLRDDPGLLEEVAGLVEWPLVLCGEFEPEYLAVPQEVLIATMRNNQKYFALLDKNGKLSNKFIIVSNMPDPKNYVVKGNQKVIRARLSDAKFFWDQDLQQTLESRLPQLKDITFHEKLGSVLQKVDRIKKLAVFLSASTGAAPQMAERAASLCKADLVSGMVREFPEVQGVMGSYYARAEGMPGDVADAIAAHYSPAGPNDACPTAPVSVTLALADKIDTLVGFFAMGQKPTGSKDPYALRRAALGIIRLLVENNVRLVLEDVFARAMLNYLDQDCAAIAERLKQAGSGWKIGERDIASHYNAFCGADIAGFLDDRLKVMLRDQGFRFDLIEAVLAQTGRDDIVQKIERLKAIAGFLKTETGTQLIVAYRRAVNIVRAEEKKDGKTYDNAVNDNILNQPEEAALFSALETATSQIAPALEKEDYQAAMTAMATLRLSVDAFFDKVTVNDNDATIRENRLRLLSRIRSTLDQVADFSRVEG